jgi:hypothetical protein
VLIANDIRFALDPVCFARAAGFDLDRWQADLLTARPQRALLNCSRQSGKSTVCAIAATHTAAYEANSLVVIVSPSQRQSAEMLRNVRQLHAKVDGLPELAAESVLKIELANGSRVLALPGAQDGKTIRGLAGARLVIVDEAARVEDELLAAVRPMLATRSDGAFIMLSTPAGKRGAFFDLWHDNDPKWTRVRVPASDCPRISKEWLAEELKALGAARFSEEYELAFIDADSSAFPTSIIDRAFTTELLPLWQ